MRKHFCKTTPTVRAQVAWEKDQTRVHKPFLKFPNIFWPDLHHLPILRKRFYHHVSNLENVKAGFIFSQINLWQRVVASNWAAGYLDIWSRKGRLLSMFPIDPLYHPIFFPSIKNYQNQWLWLYWWSISTNKGWSYLWSQKRACTPIEYVETLKYKFLSPWSRKGYCRAFSWKFVKFFNLRRISSFLIVLLLHTRETCYLTLFRTNFKSQM